MIKKIVITGGPAGGKDELIRIIKRRRFFKKNAVFVPEVATALFHGGFPNPGKDLSWCPEWQTLFQQTIVAVQLRKEDAWALAARERNAKLMICNRGLADGAAYLPSGPKVLCQICGLSFSEVLARYDAVIHMESVATAHPELFGRTGNQFRYEHLDQAQSLEYRIREVWSAHCRWFFVPGQETIKEKVRLALKVINKAIL